MEAKVNFENQARDFLEKLFQALDIEKIKIEDHWDVDHLCYRVESLDHYYKFKEQFAGFSKLLIESPVNGRPISTFKLHQPILFQQHQISVIELPAPKPGKVVKEGFEHIEVVCDVPFSDLERQYSRLQLDKGGLKKDFNQELEISLGERNIKFHHLSLESVIRLEENKRVFDAIKESEILKILKPFGPLIAGTFPLGLQSEKSDVDILLQASDLDYIQEIIEAYFSPYKGFRLQKTKLDKQLTLISNFVIDTVPFELFVQNTESIRQKAYRHFQAEEKILKMGGEQLRQKIKNLRLEGYKTEPAFAKALNLSGDPYEELLKLHSRPISQIIL